MARYKPAQRNGMFIPVVFEEQSQPGTFEFALHHLVEPIREGQVRQLANLVPSGTETRSRRCPLK